MTRTICRGVVRAASLVTPRVDRGRWLGEWLAEVDHSWTRPAGAGRRCMLTMRTCTALTHALWLRKEQTNMNSLLQDLQVSARMLWRQRAFSVVAVATLALGIGANSAIFSIVNRTLLTPLPFGNPEQLVQVWETVPAQGIEENTPAPSTLDVWRAGSRLASGFAAYSSATVNITGGGDPERLRSLRASADLIPVLDLHLTLGRGFTADEDRFGGPRAVLLTHGFWARRFHSDPSIVGQTVTLDGDAAVVAGVLPDDLPMSLRGVDVWVPLALKPIESRDSRMLWVVARAKPGVTNAALQQDLDAAMHRDGAGDGIGVNVKSMDEELRGGVRLDLLMIFGVSGVVLLIACANVMTMLLARGLSRQRELAIRGALGAGRARLARMLIAESVVLGVAGGAVGLLVGAWAVRLLQHLMPASLAATVSGGFDARVLAFTFAVALIASLLASVAPLLTSRTSLVVSGRTADSHERRGTAWLRASLVSAQMALAVVLLSGAALLTRSFIEVAFTPTGFNADGVLTAQIPRGDTDSVRRTLFYTQLIDAIRAIPGVDDVGLINGVPIRFFGGGSGFQVDDEHARPKTVLGHHRIVSAGYFRTMGIPMLAGEPFSGREVADGEGVVIVSESFVRAAWPQGGSAIGRRVRWGADGSFSRVIGVVSDVRLVRSAPPAPHVYLPYTQVSYAFYAPSDVVIRTSGRPGTLAGPLRDAVRRLDPNQPVATVMTMNEVLAQSMGGRRFTLSLMAAFAGLALVLCAIGIYGVLSYAVRRRTREFGVRMAIGATSGRVRAEVLRQGLVMTGVGAVAGAAGAVLTASGLATIVPGITAFDAMPVAIASALLLGVSALACDIPARRAMRVDPIVALRDQ
jgi:predicted permease